MLRKLLAVNVVLMMGVAGCSCNHTEVTCYSASDPCEPEGIPYYLPKPLLIVTKNFRGVEDAGVGQLGVAPIPTSFDNQAQYADVKANISSSVAPTTGSGKDGSTPPAGSKQTATMGTAGDTLTTNNNGVVPPGTFKDGVTPDTFYTYHIVFVPDLTQKYKIKIKGGAGEFRAAMSLVNGWMFTGLGPFYLKDSSTAQNILACGGALTLGGRGVADVVTSLADLSKVAGKPQTGTFDSTQVAGRLSEIKLIMDRNGLRPEPLCLPNFAEIHVYESYLHEGHMEWRPIVEKSFDRTILGIVTKTTVTSPPPPPAPKTDNSAQPGQNPGTVSPPSGDKKPGAPSNQGVPPKGTQQSGLFFGQPTAVENSISNAVAQRFIDLVPQGTPQAALVSPQAAPPAGSTPGNNVTVNVNPQRPLIAAGCNLLPCCKQQRPRNVQQIIIGPDNTLADDSSTVGPGLAGQGLTLSGPPPHEVTPVSRP